MGIAVVVTYTHLGFIRCSGIQW